MGLGLLLRLVADQITVVAEEVRRRSTYTWTSSRKPTQRAGTVWAPI